MKETFEYPKTLRNYQDLPIKPNTFLNPLTNSKSYKSFSSYNSKKTVEQQEHNMGDYYVLTNPSEIKSKQNKKKKTKKKTKSKESHLNQALKYQLNSPTLSYNQIGPQNILHCRSLEKLQIISNDRSQQIKVLMNEKGFLMAENEDLRAKLMNPTYREQDFVQKIAQRQFQIQNLKQALRRKQEAILDIEKDYKLQIQRLKVKHQQEVNSLREEMSRLRYERLSQSSKKYTNATMTTANYTSNLNQRTYKPDATYTTYNPIKQVRPSNNTTVVNSNSYQNRVTQQHESGGSHLVTGHSLNNGNLRSHENHGSGNYYQASSSNIITSKSNQKNMIENLKQPYKTYVGEDGYERRIYTQQNGQSVVNHIKNTATISQNKNLLQNPIISQAIKYSSSNTSNQYINSPFTNQKITTYVSKQPTLSPTINLYKYSESTYKNQTQLEKPSLKYDSGQHNQNLYSQSLTFQCFNDFN